MKIYNKSVKGAGHIDSGLPCQDYSISQSFDKGCIIVISDGHGGQTYVRSQVGSKLACEIAVKETKHFVSVNYEVLKSKGIRSVAYTPDGGATQDPLFTALFTSIHDKWYNAIVQDSQNKAFTDEENFKLGKENLKKAYGCTLMVAVKTIDFTFIYQLGDGRIFTIIPFIRRWQQPVPWDSQCEDNITTSLCNVNPIKRFRYYLNSSENQPFAIFLCSDGIEDCFEGQHNDMFASEKMEVEYTEILSNFLQKETFDEICAKFLSKESALGSKDDMSIAFIIDDNYNVQDKWIELNRLYRGAFILKSEYNNYRIIIDQNKGRLSTLDKNILQLDAAIRNLEPDITAKYDQLLRWQQEKTEMENRPAVCESFIELIGNLSETIKVWCDQYSDNNSMSATNKFYDALRGKLESAIYNIKVKLEEMQQQIPGRVSQLENEIKNIKTAFEQLNNKKERYKADRLRHQNKKEKIEQENEEYESLKEEKKKAFDQYTKDNIENLKHISEEIKESIGLQVTPYSNDANEEVKYVGRSWNIAKSPEEYIQITVYNNNVQLELTNSQGINNHSISLEDFNKLHTIIDESYRTNLYSFEPINKCVTIITFDENEGMVSVELEHEPANRIWEACMALIKKHQ